MLNNTQFSIAVHVLTALAYNEGVTLPSEKLAETVGTNASFLRQIIGKLASAGLVETKMGKGGGAHLARPPSNITLLDVFRASSKDEIMCRHKCTIDSRCDVAKAIPAALDEIDQQLRRVVESELSRTTVADILRRHVTAPA